MYLVAIGAVVLIFVSAFAAVEVSDLLGAIICFSVMGGGLVLLFIVLQAPEVAMAQATIGTGLTTAFFIATLNSVMERFK